MEWGKSFRTKSEASKWLNGRQGYITPFIDQERKGSLVVRGYHATLASAPFKEKSNTEF